MLKFKLNFYEVKIIRKTKRKRSLSHQAKWLFEILYAK